MAYLGCCCCCCCFIEPQPLGFVEEEVVLCVYALHPPTSPHTPSPPPCCFFPREGSRVSSHYRLCVWGERAAVCLHTRLFSLYKATPLPSCLPARLPACMHAQSGSVLQRKGTDSCHCSLGHCPGPVCLSVYLSASVCQLVCPSLCVTLLLWHCWGLLVSCLAAKRPNETGLVWKSSHTLHY